MLHGLRLLSKIKRHGVEAGYDGIEAQACPYTSPDLAQAWHSGWRVGRANYVRENPLGGKNERRKDHRRTEAS